jgi:predicted permease
MRWLLRRLVTRDDWRTIETDLAELYEHRRREVGDRLARRWLRRQRASYAVRLLSDRARTAIAERTNTMPHVWRDLSYSVRTLVRTPALAATIVLTVGIGLGATTGLMAVIRAVLLNPLPYADSTSLYWIYTDNPPYRFRFSVVDYRALEADHPAFSSVAGYQITSVTVTDGSLAEQVTIKAVTGSYFPLLAQQPLHGRLFVEADDVRDERIAVLTAKYWTDRFARDPAAIGRTVSVDGIGHTVVGVLQEDVGPLENGIALFTVARWPTPKRRGPFFTTVLGRLRPGIPREAAVSTLRATNARLFPLWRSSYQDEKATWGLQDLKSRAIGEIGPTLWLMLGAVACVLLIASVNAVNLLVGRALNRRRELAIRSALGASRRRLVQHLLAETTVLIAAAAGFGLVVAFVTVEMVASYGAGYVPRLNELEITGWALGWLAALAAVCAILIFAGGFVPAIWSSHRNVDRALRAAGRSPAAGVASRRARRALVAIEFALATPLLVAAVLLITSLNRLQDVAVGIDTERVLTAAVSLPAASYPDDADRRGFWDRARERITALPGVERAAIADSRPPVDAGNINNFDLEDRPTPPGQNQPLCTWVAVTPDFFGAAGVRLERGRLLDNRSVDERVVVVDRIWADRFYPGENPIGRRFREGGDTTGPLITVVGVVSAVKWTGLDGDDQGTVYWPFVDMTRGYLILRARGETPTLKMALTQAVRELDPGIAVTDVATGAELVDSSIAAPRYLSGLVAMFGLTSLVLSVVGIYGVMTYFVQQHTHEIGIRLALGGEPAHVRRLIVWQGLRVVSVGVALGVAAALLTARVLGTLLFGVAPTDPATMLAVPLLLLGIAALACSVPGRRAGRLDPAVILRE